MALATLMKFINNLMYCERKDIRWQIYQTWLNSISNASKYFLASLALSEVNSKKFLPVRTYGFHVHDSKDIRTSYLLDPRLSRGPS